MPSTLPELRKLMSEWFGEDETDLAAQRFLESRGYYEVGIGLWETPVPAHNATPEEFAVIRYLVEEWGHWFRLIDLFPENKFKLKKYDITPLQPES